MENQFNPYVRDAENSQACPETQLWEFPMPGSMDEINQAANSQVIATIGFNLFVPSLILI